MALETIIWFRDDLRLIDNDALTWAVEEASRRGATLLPVFIREATSGLDRAAECSTTDPYHGSHAHSLHSRGHPCRRVCPDGPPAARGRIDAVRRACSGNGGGKTPGGHE
ncbi:deoxyribodipyrimidine photo-lyase [Corynebacterium macclintockiae]|uniref:deoxyribodipyrimidine photo-lyase n=1 Tax=Corynebacterium macclintockiae TaxID=2913501 RepID=UPI003EBFADF4